MDLDEMGREGEDCDGKKRRMKSIALPVLSGIPLPCPEVISEHTFAIIAGERGSREGGGG